MSRPEFFEVVCDECGRPFPAGWTTRARVFTDHTAANRVLTEQGWYYDAKTDRCPEHWPQVEEEE